MHNYNNIGVKLIDWYSKNKRQLPWRDTNEPYKIWVSEVILQQTRVNQGLEYYYRFIERFPTVFDLAAAPQDDVFKLWQGLGYYSRARNMHFAAKQVVEEFDGKFPNSIAELKKLKGIGDYTAAAIASIAFNKPEVVVDGNVYRVISRLFEIDTPINNTSAYSEFASICKKILSNQNPGEFNQSIMELGAMVCSPKNPKCTDCPISNFCKAFKNNTQLLFPVKTNKIITKNRYFYYVVIQCDNTILMHKRTGNDIWQNLYDFPLFETDTPLEQKVLLKKIHLIYKVSDYTLINISPLVVHKLTHQHLHAVFIHFKTKKINSDLLQSNILISLDKISGIALPRLVDRYLQNEFGFEK